MNLGEPCYHCRKYGHWQADCPLMLLPDDKDDHERRIAEITQRFLNLEIGPVAKRKMIEKEKSLWTRKQKELARK